MSARSLLFVSLLTLMNTAIFAQTAPSLQWQKSLGGSGNDDVSSIQQTADGGYIVAGSSDSSSGDVTGNHGGADFWIAKLSGSGALQWQKSLGGSTGDIASYVQQTTDGGYFVAGYSESTDGQVTGNHGGQDYWVVKLDDTGAIQWQRSLGGSEDDICTSAQQTADGGYIVAGYSQSTDGDITGNIGGLDYWVVKLSAAGAIQWQKSLGGTDLDYGNAIRQAADGGYIVAGYSSSTDGQVTGNHGDYDYWIVKLNDTGAIQWEKSLGSTNGDRATATQPTADGGCIVAGYTTTNNGDVTGNHGGYDYWIVKLTNTGALQWEKSLGGTTDDAANAIQLTADGGYIVAGVSNSVTGDVTGNHGSYDYWLVKLDNTGNLQWQKSLGGTQSDAAKSIQQTTDGGFIVAGSTFSTDGDVTGSHGNSDAWVVKLSATTAVENASSPSAITILPNPTTGYVSVKGTGMVSIQVYNTIGQMVTSANSAYGISLGNQPVGLYFIQLIDNYGSVIYTGKVVKQ